ncbi:hypothetical protein [Litorisediminicola beolgyonensis]|uniref:BppU N-terminal domain-containing protein n=1 Tax=Litorisediminicola beolgyonensis TaxID=1173614 RepID=A0ABW3ZIA7_9RHOB
MDSVFIGQNDTAPDIELQLFAPGGAPMDLTSAVSVELRVVDAQLSPVFSGMCTVFDAENGWVRYEWQADDTAEAGTFLGKFIVTFADQRMTVPNNGGTRIVVDREYAAG